MSNEPVKRPPQTIYVDSKYRDGDEQLWYFVGTATDYKYRSAADYDRDIKALEDENRRLELLADDACAQQAATIKRHNELIRRLPVVTIIPDGYMDLVADALKEVQSDG